MDRVLSERSHGHSVISVEVVCAAVMYCVSCEDEGGSGCFPQEKKTQTKGISVLLVDEVRI
jgi:hypothetical protein